MKSITTKTTLYTVRTCFIKQWSSTIVLFDCTLTTKQTEHAGLPFLPIISNKEEGNGN